TSVTLAPNGAWVGGRPELAPDGGWVGRGPPTARARWDLGRWPATPRPGRELARRRRLSFEMGRAMPSAPGTTADLPPYTFRQPCRQCRRQALVMAISSSPCR